MYLNNVDISDNELTEISGLSNLKSLGSLDLNCNHITELKGLENLNNLYEILLEGRNLPPEVLKQIVDENIIILGTNEHPIDAKKAVRYCQKNKNSSIIS